MGWSFTKVGKAESSNFGSPSLGQLSLKYPGDNQMETSERLIGLELKRQNRAGNRQLNIISINMVLEVKGMEWGHQGSECRGKKMPRG